MTERRAGERQPYIRTGAEACGYGGWLVAASFGAVFPDLDFGGFPRELEASGRSEGKQPMISKIPDEWVNPANRAVLAHLEGTSAHSDVAEVLTEAVTPLGDVQLFCRTVRRIGMSPRPRRA